MQELAEAVRKAIGEGRRLVVGRVTEIKGFSTLSTDLLVAVDDRGRQHGDLLGRPGSEALAAAAADMLSGSQDSLRRIVIEVHGKEVAELGLACGGRADVLLQPSSAIPHKLWELLADRAPAALVTRVGGEKAAPAAIVADREGGSWGSVGEGEAKSSRWVGEAVSMLAAGRSASRLIEDVDGGVLVQAWVPVPRLVVVGSGEMVDSLRAQGALLGWELRASEEGHDLGELLEWAGATAALIVLSHDPHVDTPALRAGLERAVPYVGAMGSRSTQSRRLERLASEGVSADLLDRIHRPIGLDLGGRRAPEVALSVAAEILACHCGRQGRSLKDTAGPIHGTPR